MTCNTVPSRKESESTEGGPMEGVYIVETSRRLHECAVEHMKDAEAYSAKSHIVKHWILSHPEMNTPPQIAFRITSIYRDCLYRQIWEALNYSEDNILNSKNEYLNYCICVKVLVRLLILLVIMKLFMIVWVI
jgi:hypothetical protein